MEEVENHGKNGGWLCGKWREVNGQNMQSAHCCRDD